MVKKLVVMSLLVAVLFVQQLALYSFIGVQLTFVLLFVYSKFFNIKEMSLIIIIHLFLNSIVFGGVTLLLSPFMFLGYFLIPLTKSIHRRIENEYLLGLFAGLIGLIYLWILIIPSVMFFQINLIAYIISDIIWEFVLFVSNFLTVILLYKPLCKLFKVFLEDEK